jgi:segregation and condensation protein B
MSLPKEQLPGAVEALLFASDSPLTLTVLAETLQTDPMDVAEVLEAVKLQLDRSGRGVQLTEMAGGYLLTTREEHAPWVRALLRGKRKARLSRAALETLAIVAYKQPVTRPEIEEIRGVDSGSALATLLERDLVTIRGRADVVGRPLLYGTAEEFLTYFGLRDLSELPRPEELRALMQSREDAGDEAEESEAAAPNEEPGQAASGEGMAEAASTNGESAGRGAGTESEAPARR